MCLLRVPGPPCPTCQLSVKRPGYLISHHHCCLRLSRSEDPTSAWLLLCPPQYQEGALAFRVNPSRPRSTGAGHKCLTLLLHHRLFGDTVVPYSLSETVCITQQPGAWLYSRNLRAAQCISCYIHFHFFATFPFLFFLTVLGLHTSMKCSTKARTHFLFSRAVLFKH